MRKLILIILIFTLLTQQPTYALRPVATKVDVSVWRKSLLEEVPVRDLFEKLLNAKTQQDVDNIIAWQYPKTFRRCLKPIIKNAIRELRLSSECIISAERDARAITRIGMHLGEAKRWLNSKEGALFIRLSRSNFLSSDATENQLIQDMIRDILVLKGLPLIATLAAWTKSGELGMEARLNAGTIGFLDALDKFDFSFGVKFTTYAQYRIRGNIIDETKTYGMTFDPGRGIKRKRNRVLACEHSLAQQLGRHPTAYEIAEVTSLTPETVAELLQDITSFSLSLPEWLLDEKKLQRENVVEAMTGDLGFDLVIKHEQVQRLLYLMHKYLTPRERLVLQLYHIEGDYLHEIGKRLDVTESRISQIHRGAIRKLRPHLDEQIAPEDLDRFSLEMLFSTIGHGDAFQDATFQRKISAAIAGAA